ncbi:MAG: formate dehydrogenase accessory sulfurtransferase FdhD [Cytophagales bacterium]|nr:formate dehydrogenase accessory sulfurtransferase FdhD [Cytophagales bacterium]
MSIAKIEHIVVKKVNENNVHSVLEALAIEDPLFFILTWSSPTGKMSRQISVTMRTPGNDDELAVGYLFNEGIIIDPASSIQSIEHIRTDSNKIEVVLKENILPNLKGADRRSFVSSSCGVCGKTEIDYIESPFNAVGKPMTISKDILFGLQDTLREKQSVFEETGGIHAAALFTSDGNLILVREDVGRHNALDKVIGNALLSGLCPLVQTILLLSGRASYELIQKASMAGIRIIASVGAPSSLAVSLAREMKITLIGFLRDGRFNIYTEFDNFLDYETSNK